MQWTVVNRIGGASVVRAIGLQGKGGYRKTLFHINDVELRDPSIPVIMG